MALRRAIKAAKELAARNGWISIPAALMLAGFWLHEHEARARAAAALEALKRQTSVRVRRLEQQAASRARAANQEAARAARELAAERRKLAERDRELEAQQTEIERREQEQVGRIAALPLAAVGGELEKRLGPAAGSPGGAAPSNLKSPGFELTAAGARKVDEAFVELDACRAERTNASERLADCAARAAADEAALGRQAAAMGELNRALAAKEQAWRAERAEAQAELRAARGTFLGRLARTTEHVAIGVGIGVAIGMAAH